MEALTDKTIKCADCGNDFVFSKDEQQFFREKGFTNDPKRCKPCKAKRAATGQFNSRVKNQQQTETVCAACNTATTIPFKPTNGRPVYCRSCFQKTPRPEKLESIGWCSSCDLIAEHAVLAADGRQCCMKCGDYLIFQEPLGSES